MLKLEEFNIKLDTDLIGRSFVYLEECDSTNNFLFNTKDYNHHGTVVLSEYQSKGKGRKDRTWESSKGQNLTLSILLRKDIKSKLLGIINLGASLAVAQTLENLYQLDVELKWPNDVLIKRKKIAGILLESSSKGSKIEKLVVGIGINVNQVGFQGKFIIPPTSVKKEFHETISRERLLSELLNNFEEILKICFDNPNKIIEYWKERCDMIGEHIKVVENDESKFGIFSNIDDEGYLILKSKDKTERIHFGDVSLRQ
ncbi:MAG: biotin--[acetyl-CoA-carboxylase] ligase [Ignavibacteriae bacterium]|nr:biotin--[acetyl-CoA-carboxylase] ligase [Ignavibacteriota bacterium]NOG99601.1 biotin--[acetyl-CoA-carboxylase] ligase [Ignavibacteriota bacterium]